jgi:hypothetical protein
MKSYHRELGTPTSLAAMQQEVCQFEKHMSLEWVLVQIPMKGNNEMLMPFVMKALGLLNKLIKLLQLHISHLFFLSLFFICINMTVVEQSSCWK